ncbi:hypothetical protein thsrh120_45960 [Rhizobium sp. No.120]
MDAGRQMHDDIDAGKRIGPIRIAIHRPDNSKAWAGAAADRPIIHPPVGKLRAQSLTDKTRRTRYQDHPRTASAFHTMIS